MWMMSKKTIAIFSYKQQLLSLDMKTKVVQHVPRINLSYFKFQIFNFFQIFFPNFQIFSGSQLLSDFQTFFITALSILGVDVRVILRPILGQLQGDQWQ